MPEATQYPQEPSLVQYPHPALRREAEPVTEFDAELADFVQAMYRAMDKHKGVGLAAPQLAVSKQIFVTNHTAGDEELGNTYRVWINPRIENSSGTTVYEEGCLSFPNIFARVDRHNAFDIVYQDETGAEHRQRLDVEAGDFLGIVTQHELDHLHGKLFVDLLTPGQITLVRRKLRELEQEYKKATGKKGALLRR